MEQADGTARVALYVGDFRLEGMLHVGAGAGGHNRRVSDALNNATAFVALTDVSVTEPNFMSDEPELHEIVIVRKGEIKLAIPLD